MIKYLGLVFLSYFVLGTAFAQYHQTLPKGVRLFLTRHIQTDVKSSFNHSKSETPFSYEIQTDIATLESIDNAQVQQTLEFLSQYPEAYNKINLGTHKIEADANIKVEAYAFGYGITDRLTAYMAIPIFDANVNLKYKKVKNDTNQEVAEILQNTIDDDLAQGIGSALEGISGPNGSTIQNAVVNGLGYKEIGDWSGQGLGDVEFGLMYNLVNETKYGLKATLGGVAPTGYVDDPDIIQDIGFGDGQWDAFVELGGGYSIANNLTSNSWVRYTHQFESEKELRIPFNESVSVSDEKGDFTEKLGNKLDIGTNLDIGINDWLSIEPSYLYTQTGKAQYKSSNSMANSLLANNTDSNSHTIKLLAAISSVKLFKQKKFLLPAQLKASFQQIIQGKNTPKADRVEFEFSMFF